MNYSSYCRSPITHSNDHSLNLYNKWLVVWVILHYKIYAKIKIYAKYK